MNGNSSIHLALVVTLVAAAALTAAGCSLLPTGTAELPVASLETPSADDRGRVPREGNLALVESAIAESEITRLPAVTGPEAVGWSQEVIPVAHMVDDEGTVQDHQLVTELKTAPAELEDALKPLEEVDHAAGRAKDVFAIDLANALALGGANNLQIQLARERVIEAQADWAEAHAMWLPSLRFGVGYNKHDGRLQETQGNILEVSRNSLFVGGGAGLGDMPLAGGASGPARLMVNLSLADAAMEPLVARQRFDAASAGEMATVNDSLLAIAVGYYDLVESYARLANAELAVSAIDEVVRLTRLFAETGQGAEAELHRAETDRAYWQQVHQDSLRQSAWRTAELRQLLRLDAGVNLVPVEERIAPVELLDEGITVEALLTTAMMSRPELAQHQSLVGAALMRVRQECIRPWLPYVQVGASAGAFGGGTGSNFDNQSGRSDVDLSAVWELRHLGLGNMAMRRQRDSQLRQAQIERARLADQVVAEVMTAAADVGSYRRQIKSTREGVVSAERSYEANLERIRQAEGLPLEMLQAIRARYEAQNGLTKAISDYNRAQFELLRALGRPPA